MKAIRVFQCSVLCAAALHFAAQGALAQNAQKRSEPEKIKIGEEYYTRAQIVADFLNVAFSDTIWNEDTGEDFPMHLDYLLHRLKKDPAGAKSEFQKAATGTWFGPYLFGQSGWPKQNVINKWTGPITIAVGWPGNAPALDLENTDEVVALFEKHIQNVAPRIADYTGLPVELINFDAAKDKGESFARIRIVPIHTTNLRNFFKTLRLSIKDGQPHETTFLNTYEQFMWAGVPFTPNVRSQVDGYLLPNPDNGMGVVVCKIVSDIDTDLIRALISECLVRALGLPNLSNVNSQALIGNWNRAHDTYSLLPSLDGRKKAIWPENYMHIGGVEQPVFHSSATDKKHLPVMPTPYDAAMARILYCPALKPGMNKFEALQSIALDDDCIGKILAPEKE